MNIKQIAIEALKEAIEALETQLEKLKAKLAGLEDGGVHTDGLPTQQDPNPVDPPHGPQG